MSKRKNPPVDDRLNNRIQVRMVRKSSLSSMEDTVVPASVWIDGIQVPHEAVRKVSTGSGMVTIQLDMGHIDFISIGMGVGDGK